MASPRMSVRLYAFSFPEQIYKTHGHRGFFLHIAHTHLLEGVDVPFGGYDL